MYLKQHMVHLVFMLLFSSLTCSLSAASQNKICLTMIVKNEEKIIERCLNSVKDIIDVISICDTGSTDRTVEIIENYIRENKLVGKVHRHQWTNFGTNRSLSVLAAQDTLKTYRFPLESTYLLLVDADMILKVNPEFKKENLKEDAFLVLQKSRDHSYYNMRMVRASLPWKCVGVTHEYWACQVPCQESKLHSLYIDDRDDGGCKADKFERDIRLLTQGLKDEPENGRYMFYLGQSYKSLKQYDDAIKWYQTCIDKGGWLEELWYSKYMIGQCYQELKQWDRALVHYLEAYQLNPNRSEPLHEISKHYRNDGKHHLAYSFAQQGAKIPYPQDQILFVSHPIYEYLFDEEISISAYFTPYKEEGYAAANRLILKRGIPDYIKDQAYRNMLFYVPKLKNARYIPIKIQLPLVDQELGTSYNPLNPTIRKTAKGYDVICRTINYIQIGAKHFQSLELLDKSKPFNTINFLIEYDPQFKLISQKEIIEDLPRERRAFRNITGLEDCRLFKFKGTDWFSCTTVDTSLNGLPQVSLCQLSNNRSTSHIKVEKLIPLDGPDAERCEKNWLPFVKDNELHLIHSYNPFIIYKPKIDFDNQKMIQRNEFIADTPIYDTDRFAGSAPPIVFDKGYLFVIHETVYTDERNYLHRFVYMDEDLKIKKISKPFIFLHKGIEYVCGLTLNHANNKLILSIGIEDREAYLCEVEVDTVRLMLESVPTS